MQKILLWVLYFRYVEDLPDIFQNHNGRMIFLKMTLNLVKIGRNLREKLRFDFFFFRLILKGFHWDYYGLCSIGQS